LWCGTPFVQLWRLPKFTFSGLGFGFRMPPPRLLELLLCSFRTFQTFPVKGSLKWARTAGSRRTSKPCATNRQTATLVSCSGIDHDLQRIDHNHISFNTCQCAVDRDRDDDDDNQLNHQAQARANRAGTHTVCSVSVSVSHN
jgi:hypothetical protein